MGAFVDLVRRGVVKGPQQRAFNLDAWKKGFQETASDNADKRLAHSGEWFAEEFEKLRRLTLECGSKADIGRSDDITLGFANQQWAVVKDKVRKAFEKIVHNNEFISEQLSEITISNIAGAPFDPEVVVEAIVDGARYPLSYQFPEKQPGGIPATEQFSAAAMMFALGGYYDTLEQWWLECVWNEYGVTVISDNEALIAPADSGLHKLQAISRFRQGTRHREAVTQSTAWLQQVPDEVLKRLLASRHTLSSFKRKGKTHVKPIPMTKQNMAAGTATRIMLTHEYLDPFYRKRRRNFNGLTIAQVLDALELLSALPDQIYKFLPGKRELRNLDDVRRYSPKVDVEELTHCFRIGLGISEAQSNWLIGYLSFPRNVREQLWFKPLVRLNDNVVGVLAPALDGINFTRLVDQLINTIDDLEGEAGPLFETYVRNELIKNAPHFRFNHHLHILKEPFTFTVGPKFEEIDLVYVLGSQIFIGEAKSMGFPSTPLEVFHYVNRIRAEAIPQVLRKSEFVAKHLTDFVKAAALDGAIDQNLAMVHPVVVTNQPFLSGFEIDGAPVTDPLILTKYFRDGYLEKFGYRDEYGQLQAARKDFFYRDESEAINNHSEYLRNPPQIAVFEPYVALEDTKYPTPLNGFRSLVIRSYQMHMPYDEVRAEIDEHRRSATR